MTNVQPYFPFTLRLYAHVLQCLGDGNFTGLTLFDKVKDCWKRRDSPNDLLLKPLEKGLPIKIGEWCFDLLFEVEEEGEAPGDVFYRTLDNENFIWFIDDVVESCNLAGHTNDVVVGMADIVRDVYGAFDKYYGTNDEEIYWKLVDGESREELIALYHQLSHEPAESRAEMRSIYAFEIADRILHDRQLCGFIAYKMIEVGFDGATEEGMRSQWMNRVRWPERVKAILRSRDRGRCGACGIDIVQELREEGHIDHIIPLATGGCNDLVNLQLLCSTCNKSKSAKEQEVGSSIPQYLRRSEKVPVASR